MKHNLLKKVVICMSLTGLMTACTKDDPEPLPGSPVSIAGGNSASIGDTFTYSTDENGDMHITVSEMTGTYAVDLLDGVTSEGKTKASGADIYTVKFTYQKWEKDAEGEDALDDAGEKIPTWTGPEFVGTGLAKTTDTLAVISNEFADAFVHSATVAERNTEIAAAVAHNAANPDDQQDVPPMLYDEGSYHFTYNLDNGNEEIVTRNIYLTVEGSEDPVEEVVITTADGFEVPKDFSIQMVTSVLPTNSTFPLLSYESSDTSIATVSETGVVFGVALGSATITVTSADGLVSSDVTANVVPLTDPVGVEITLAGDVATEAWVQAGGTTTLGTNLLPLEYDFGERDITWSSDNEAMVTVDENGVISGVGYDNDVTLRTATVTATITADTSLSFDTTVNISPGSDLLFSADNSFDDMWNDDILTRRTADNSPGDQLNLGTVEYAIDGDANQTAAGVMTIDGKSLYIDSTAGDVRIKFKKAAFTQDGFVADTTYVLSYDLKMIEGKYIMYVNPNKGGWHPYPGNWTASDMAGLPLDADNMMRVTHNIGADKIDLTGAMVINMHTGGNANGGKFYIDNIKLEAQ